MTFAQIIIVLECIVLVCNVGAVIYKLIKPAVHMQERVEELEDHNKEDRVRIKKLEDLSMDQCKILIQMLDQMAEGYHAEKIKSTRDKIIEVMLKE